MPVLLTAILCPIFLTAQWLELDSGTDTYLYSVDFRNPNCGWVAGGNNQILQTRDGGQSWELYNDYTYPVNEVWLGISCLSDHSLFACGYVNHIGYAQQNWTFSVNDGQSWVAQNHWGTTRGTWNDVFFLDDQNGWMVGYYGSHSNSQWTTGGVNGEWENVPVDNDVTLVSVFFIDKDHGWTVGGKGSLHYTVDGGKTWEFHQLDMDFNLREVFFSDLQNGWIVGYNDQLAAIWKTTDGGNSWSEYQPSGIKKLFSICFADQSTGWTCGSQISGEDEVGVVLQTIDGGENWKTEHVQTNCSALLELDIGNGVAYASGSNGVILKNAFGQDFLHFMDAGNMPTRKYGFAYATDGTQIYAIGGIQSPSPWDPSLVSDRADVFSPAEKKWSKLTDGLVRRMHGNAVFVPGSDKLYVFNGFAEEEGQYTDAVEIIDVTTGLVSAGSSHPFPTVFGGAAAWNDKIYVFGGKSEQGFSRRLYEYDTKMDSWTRLEDMPEPRITQGEIVDGKLYVLGGENFFPVRKISSYDIAGDEWTQAGELPTSVGSCATSATGKFIWLAGSAEDPVFLGLYNTETQEFTRYYSDMIRRSCAGAAVIGYDLYVFGGMQENVEEPVMLNNTQFAEVGDFVEQVELIHNENKTLIFEIFPNPGAGSFELVYRVAKEGNVMIEILDTTGKCYHRERRADSPGLHRYFFDDKKLPAGLYFVSVRADGIRQAAKWCNGMK
jgi:photosystem II stability/assembly factor-like uncharacterized protein